MLSTAVAVWVVGSLGVIALTVAAVADVEKVRILKKWQKGDKK